MFRQLQSQQSSRSNRDSEKPAFYSMNSRTQARREQMAQQEKDNQSGFWSGMGDGIVAGGKSGYSAGPHRSLNPFRFGQPIK